METGGGQNVYIGLGAHPQVRESLGIVRTQCHV